ncbi:MAG: DNA replication and repair protein RecF [Gammaproteobacteria bacterium]
MLTTVSIHNVRNIESFSEKCETYFNWFVGENGAGKTSILEAIGLLLTSKSFRSCSIKEYLRHGCNEMLITGQLSKDVSCNGKDMDMGMDSHLADHHIGLKRHVSDGTILNFNGDRVATSCFLAGIPPVQILAPDATNTVTAGSQSRRKFIDWGVFHVKHSYLEDWRSFNRILKQRNAALKVYPPDLRMLKSINIEYIRLAHQVSEARRSYWDNFCAFINETRCLSKLNLILKMDSADIDVSQLGMRYLQGWNEDLSLKDALYKAQDMDLKYKTSQCGPHRAGFELKIKGFDVAKCLSRGQIKIILYWLKLCQSQHLSQVAGQKTIFLVDDIASELDVKRRERIYELMFQTCSQVFGTGIELDAVLSSVCRNQDIRMFHVKHGQIR